MTVPAHIDGDRLAKAADESVSKKVTRWATPILLAIVGWYSQDKLGSIEEAQQTQAIEQRKTGDDVAQIKSDVRDVSTRMDVQVLTQLTDLRKRVEQIEQRGAGQ